MKEDVKELCFWRLQGASGKKERKCIRTSVWCVIISSNSPDASLPRHPRTDGRPKNDPTGHRCTPGQQPSMPGMEGVPLGATQLILKVPSNPSLSVITPEMEEMGFGVFVEHPECPGCVGLGRHLLEKEKKSLSKINNNIF